MPSTLLGKKARGLPSHFYRSADKNEKSKTNLVSEKWHPNRHSDQRGGRDGAQREGRAPSAAGLLRWPARELTLERDALPGFPAQDRQVQGSGRSPARPARGPAWCTAGGGPAAPPTRGAVTARGAQGPGQAAQLVWHRRGHPSGARPGGRRGQGGRVAGARKAGSGPARVPLTAGPNPGPGNPGSRARFSTLVAGPCVKTPERRTLLPRER